MTSLLYRLPPSPFSFVLTPGCYLTLAHHKGPILGQGLKLFKWTPAIWLSPLCKLVIVIFYNVWQINHYYCALMTWTPKRNTLHALSQILSKLDIWHTCSVSIEMESEPGMWDAFNWTIKETVECYFGGEHRKPGGHIGSCASQFSIEHLESTMGASQKIRGRRWVLKKWVQVQILPEQICEPW